MRHTSACTCSVIVFRLDVTGGSVVLNRYDHAKESHQWYLVGGTIRNRYNKEQVIDNPAHATAGLIGYAALIFMSSPCPVTCYVTIRCWQ